MYKYVVRTFTSNILLLNKYRKVTTVSNYFSIKTNGLVIKQFEKENERERSLKVVNPFIIFNCSRQVYLEKCITESLALWNPKV